MNINMRHILELTISLILAFMIGLLAGIKTTDSVITKLVDRENAAWDFIENQHHVLDAVRRDCVKNNRVDRCVASILAVEKMIETYMLNNYPGDVRIEERSDSISTDEDARIAFLPLDIDN